MKKVFMTIIFMLIINIIIIYNILQPSKYVYTENKRLNIICNTLSYLGCPSNKRTLISDGIKTAEDHTGINGVLLSCLLYTESNFDTKAKSKKGYLGIAQTKPATIIYPEVDILHGAMVLKDKLRITNGDLLKALTLYKGGRNNEAKKQAKEVLVLYNKIKTKHEKENT